MNSFKISQHRFFYYGIEEYADDERLMKLYCISVLRPEIRHYLNGIFINPTKLFVNQNEETAQKKTTKICRHLDSSNDDDDFHIGTLEDNKLEEYG